MLARAHPAFDGLVILFQNVIEVLKAKGILLGISACLVLPQRKAGLLWH
jgi:hypothetical protein